LNARAEWRSAFAGFFCSKFVQAATYAFSSEGFVNIDLIDVPRSTGSANKNMTTPELVLGSLDFEAASTGG